MKRRAVPSNDSPCRSGKKFKKPRGKGRQSETTARSGDYELDLNQFPDKLRWLLDKNSAPEALWWLPEGDAIGITKGAFQEQLLVQEFRGNKFSSITRKLNRWGFRRIDDDERVPEGSIAYSHDFFLRDNVAMMRFMKKEEDRKPTETEGEEAESKEESKSSSPTALMPQALQLLESQARHAYGPSQLSMGETPLGLAGLNRQAGLLWAPAAPLPSSSTHRQFQADLFATANPVLPGNAASIAALAPPQVPALHNTMAAELSLASLRNRLTMPVHQHQQLLLQERQRSLRGVSGSPEGANLALDPAQAPQRRGSPGALLPLQGRQSVATPSNPFLAAAAASHTQSLDLLGGRLVNRNLLAGDNPSASILTAAGPLRVSSLDPNGDTNRLLLLRRQHEQIEQERLLQLRQQLAQSGVSGNASQRNGPLDTNGGEGGKQQDPSPS